LTFLEELLIENLEAFQYARLQANFHPTYES